MRADTRPHAGDRVGETEIEAGPDDLTGRTDEPEQSVAANAAWNEPKADAADRRSSRTRAKAAIRRSPSREEDSADQPAMVHPQSANQPRGFDPRRACNGAWRWRDWRSIFGEIIVPTEMVSEFKGGKKRVSKRKLYPGYIVVNMEINDDTWYLVRETSGIGDFTGAMGRPTPMAPQDVAKIVAEDRREDRRSAARGHPLQAGRPRADQGRHVREL